MKVYCILIYFLDCEIFFRGLSFIFFGILGFLGIFFFEIVLKNMNLFLLFVYLNKCEVNY